MLYVLAGSGDGARSAASGTVWRRAPPPSSRRGTAWRIDAADGLGCCRCSSATRSPPARRHAVVVAAARAPSATAGRQFTLLATPEVGCASVTQFVGFIPPGRAPDHFHRYDEVVYVLAGEGALHIGGESAPLHPGACVHLPARLVHCLENAGPGEMEVLGVFRPAGSPAEAYYPDGTLAVVPTETRRPDAEDRAHRRGRLGGKPRPRRGLAQRDGSGAFSAPAVLARRPGSGQPEGKTSPEELLAAAHGELPDDVARGRADRRGHPARPARDDACRIVMDEVEGQGHQIVASQRRRSASAAEGSTTRGCRRRVAKADEGCPFSGLLKRAGVRGRTSRPASRRELPELAARAPDAQDVRSRARDRATLLELFAVARYAPTHHLAAAVALPRARRRRRSRRLKETAGEKEAAKLDRAPTLVLASAKLTGDLVQDEEDVCATAAAIQLVLLAATERGLATYWRTPSVLRTRPGREALGVPVGERVLGLLHFGPPEREPAPSEREPVDAYVSFLP